MTVDASNILERESSCASIQCTHHIPWDSLSQVMGSIDLDGAI